jgi:hemerythrin
MEYVWDKSLETGNLKIDSQHKELIAALNNFIRTCKTGRGKEELKKSLDFLNNYTIKHFFDEEQLQQQYKYPDFENHKTYHNEFKKAIRDLSVAMIMKGASETLVNDVQHTIGDWLVNHIKVQDVKVAVHIKNHS